MRVHIDNNWGGDKFSEFACFKINFIKHFCKNTIRVSNSLDPGPDLVSNCLQKLTADDKSHS